MTAAVHCEVRKIAYRQSKEGLVVSFVVHPDEMPASLATAPLGQRYMLALAAIGDDEQPIEPTPTPAAPQSDRSVAGKERYLLSDERERAVTRAAMLSKDASFQKWTLCASDAYAAQYIRQSCGIKNRSELLTDDKAYAAFLALETDYAVATGKLAEPR